MPRLTRYFAELYEPGQTGVARRSMQWLVDGVSSGALVILKNRVKAAVIELRQGLAQLRDDLPKGADLIVNWCHVRDAATRWRHLSHRGCCLGSDSALSLAMVGEETADQRNSQCRYQDPSKVTVKLLDSLHQGDSTQRQADDGRPPPLANGTQPFSEGPQNISHEVRRYRRTAIYRAVSVVT